MTNEINPETAAPVINANEIEFEVSPTKRVVIRELTGPEVRLCNKITGKDVGNLADNQAMASLVSVNGEKLAAFVDLNSIIARTNKFSGTEYMKIVNRFAEEFYRDFNDPKS